MDLTLQLYAFSEKLSMIFYPDEGSPVPFARQAGPSISLSARESVCTGVSPGAIFTLT